jgi:hypothetical protein
VLTAAGVAAALVLVAAGCGDDGDDSTTTGAGGESGDDMTISVSEPADGAEVDTPFDLALDTGVELGEPDTGLHHVHIYYDGDTDEGDYDLVYGPAFTVERPLDPGEHTVEAVIANADHSLTDARDEITISVGGAGAGTPGTTDDSDATTNDDDGYDD